MPTVERHGMRIAYAEAGAGETALLLHSTACSGAQWRELTGSLRSFCRVFAPDLIGYGGSDPWPGTAPLRLSVEAAMAEAVLPRDGAPIHLIGHSYGGAVAMRFAIERPERLASLTLIEPAAFHLLRDAPKGSDDHRLYRETASLAASVIQAAAQGDGCGGMAGFVDYWNGAGSWSRMTPELRVSLARRIGKVARDFEAAFNEPGSIDALRRIAAPTLIVRGGASPQPTRRIAKLVADALPNARLRTVDGQGHMLPIVRPELVNPAIVEHLFRTMAARQRPAAA